VTEHKANFVIYSDRTQSKFHHLQWQNTKQISPSTETEHKANFTN